MAFLEVIIQTQNVFEEGGKYEILENVSFCIETDLGVRVTFKDGEEYFYPWSFDGGIRKIIKKNAR